MKINMKITIEELQRQIVEAPACWLPDLMKELINKCDRDGCYYPDALGIYVRNHTPKIFSAAEQRTSPSETVGRENAEAISAPSPSSIEETERADRHSND
jgi:hypothetical protein